MQEPADASVTVSLAPNTWAEPCEEAGVCESCQPLAILRCDLIMESILASISIHCFSGVTNGGAIQHDPWPEAACALAYLLELASSGSTYVE